MRELVAQPLSADRFKPFGDVIEGTGRTPDKMINQGLCARFHDLALLDFADGRAGISLFDSEAKTAPFLFEMVERTHWAARPSYPSMAWPIWFWWQRTTMARPLS